VNIKKELRVKPAYTGNRFKQKGHQLLRYVNPAHSLVEATSCCLYQLVVDKVHYACSVMESRTSVINRARIWKELARLIRLMACDIGGIKEKDGKLTSAALRLGRIDR
jgi:hypothetical protein